MLKPAPPNSGIRFRRTDLHGMEIVAKIDNLLSSNPTTSLANGEASVMAVEHLLAAFAGLNIDNALIELDGPEIPILDGSAAPFVSLIQSAGIEVLSSPRQFLKIVEPISVSDGNGGITIYPDDHFRVTYSAAAATPRQFSYDLTYRITEESFVRDIAHARTLAFVNDFGEGLFPELALEKMILEDRGFQDEFVRHRMLDAIGDLALLGYPLIGHVVSHRSSRTLMARLVAEVLRQPRKWRILSSPFDSVAPTNSICNLIEIVSVTPQLLRVLQEDITSIYSLSADVFEQLICNLLDQMGLEVKRVGSVNSPDGGIDIVAWPKRGHFPYLLAIQAKHHHSAGRKTGDSDVRHLLSAVSTGPFQAGLLVTSTTFTANAKWFVDNRTHLLRLRDVSDLSRWISGKFLDAEEWRDLPSRIELTRGVFVDIPRPSPSDEIDR